jgi:hypothetical protein
LGLALVRGPFGSLGAAKVAIEAARASEPAASPLAARVAKLADRPAAKPDGGEKQATSATGTTRKVAAKAAKPAPEPEPEPEPAAEPRWIAALKPAERRRAKQLIGRLTEAGAPDPEGTVRRDLVGGVPAVAGFAIARALAGLDADASPETVARLLADGRDEDLDVRWRLVDGDDRVINLDLGSGKRR